MYLLSQNKDLLMEFDCLEIEQRYLPDRKGFHTGKNGCEYCLVAWAKTAREQYSVSDPNKSLKRTVGRFSTYERAQNEVLRVSNALQDSALTVYAIGSDG